MNESYFVENKSYFVGNASYFDGLAHVTLEELNERETVTRIAAIIYLSLLMIIGVPGNLLVIAVYHLSVKRRTTNRLFITALAVSDFLVCTMTVPFEIIQMTHQLTFYSNWTCKIFRAINVLLPLVSSFILIALSGDRMRRVCQPLRSQLTPRQALRCVLFVSFGALLFSWPEAVISGITESSLINNLTGYDCSFSDRFVGTSYTTIYSSTLLTIYMSCIIALIIMYIIIGQKVISHAHFRSTFTRHKSTDDTQSTASTNKLNKDIPKYSSEDQRESKSSDEEDRSRQLSELQSKSSENITKGESKTLDRKGEMKLSQSSRKVTKIAFVISFCFILSYIPSVAVKLNASVASGNFVSNATTKAVFPILARTFIINNIVNPIIYWFLDLTFREKSTIIFNRLICRT